MGQTLRLSSSLGPDQRTVAGGGTSQRGLGAAQGRGGTAEDPALTTARFRSSTCLNITLHLSLPSFFPPAYSLSRPWGPWREREAGSYSGMAWRADLAESLSPGAGMAVGNSPAETPGELFQAPPQLPPAGSVSGNEHTARGRKRRLPCSCPAHPCPNVDSGPHPAVRAKFRGPRASAAPGVTEWRESCSPSRHLNLFTPARSFQDSSL